MGQEFAQPYVEEVQSLYRDWQRLEIRYSPEYNGMDEEVSARYAEATYRGAKQMVDMLLGRSLVIDHEAQLGILLSRAEQRIRENEKIIEKHMGKDFRAMMEVDPEERVAYYQASDEMEEDVRLLEELGPCSGCGRTTQYTEAHEDEDGWHYCQRCIDKGEVTIG